MRLPALLCLVALLAGCSGAPPADPNGATTPTPTAPASTTHVEDWTLGPRDSRELNFEMSEGATVSYAMRAGSAVRWDLHSHAADGSVVTHASGEGRTAEGNFTAPFTDVYSIFARATGSTAITKVTLVGSFVVVE